MNCGKLKVVLSWDDGNYCCQFKRGRHQEDWQNMTRDEQLRSVGAMFTMGEMFAKFIKKGDAL